MPAGNIIKQLRTMKGMTQDELGAVLGVKKSSIQKYESGAIQNLKLETLKTLCEYFRVPPWLFVTPENVHDLEEILEFYMEFVDWKELIQLNNKGRMK